MKYLYEEHKPIGMTSNVKKSLFILFFVFLISFDKYLPYEQTQSTTDSIGQLIYSLYFFVFTQTLGIIHEAGHGVCYVLPCPEFITVLNGTLFQLFFPLGVAYYYKRQENAFASYIAMFFVGFSLLYTAWYISTSGQGAIVVAKDSFLGVDAYHDFYYIFNSMGILAHHGVIAGVTKFIAYLLMIVSVGMMFFDGFLKVEKFKK